MSDHSADIANAIPKLVHAADNHPGAAALAATIGQPTAAHAAGKSFFLTQELASYIVAHGNPPDRVQQQLIGETAERLGADAFMQVPPEQGAFLTFLCQLIGARRAIEIGTFTGYSALCIARGLSAEGTLVTCDINDRWTSIARKYWSLAGVERKIQLKLCRAAELFDSLPADAQFDFAFLDADKLNYQHHYEALLRHLRPGGLLVVDNVLWDGKVVAPDAGDLWATAIARFNDHVAQDARVDRVMLSVSDGVTLVRKR